MDIFLKRYDGEHGAIAGPLRLTPGFGASLAFRGAAPDLGASRGSGPTGSPSRQPPDATGPGDCGTADSREAALRRRQPDADYLDRIRSRQVSAAEVAVSIMLLLFVVLGIALWGRTAPVSDGPWHGLPVSREAGWPVDAGACDDEPDRLGTARDCAP